MTATLVRQATLDDTHAISRLFQAQVPVWQRLTADGQVESPPYEDLSIYERWLHGGPWLSLETAAIHFSHLLTHGIITLVTETDGQVTSYAEVYPGSEPPPFGRILHIAHLVAADGADSDLTALFDALVKIALDRQARLTTALSRYDEPAVARVQALGMTLLHTSSGYNVPAQSGQGFYQANDHLTFRSEQVDGWHMVIGRTESSRFHWERLWPRLWQAIPQIVAQQTHYLHLTAAGQEAFVCVQQHIYVPRSATVYCWTPKRLSSQILVGIRDWTYRAGYRTLYIHVPDATAKLLGDRAEATPQQQVIYSLPLADS